MRFRIAVAGFMVSAGVAGVAGAQGASANAGCTGVIADACQQTVDLFNYMSPQLGTALAGGNTTLAQGGNLGGRTLGLIPKVVIGVRINAVKGDIPKLQTPTPALTQRTAAPTEASFVGLPAIDAAIGVFKGFPLGVSSVGGLDLLVSAGILRDVDLGSISIRPDKKYELGYGARIGLLKESLVAPGIGISYIKRKMPTTTISSTAGTTAVALQGLALDATSLRLTVSKSLLLFGLAAGVGQDKYGASTTVKITPSGLGTTSVTVPNAEVTRTTYFADVSLNLLILKIVATGGMVSGGDIKTYNTFDQAPDKSRLYASVGVRFGL